MHEWMFDDHPSDFTLYTWAVLQRPMFFFLACFTFSSVVDHDQNSVIWKIFHSRLFLIMSRLAISVNLTHTLAIKFIIEVYGGIPAFELSFYCVRVARLNIVLIVSLQLFFLLNYVITAYAIAVLFYCFVDAPVGNLAALYFKRRQTKTIKAD